MVTEEQEKLLILAKTNYPIGTSYKDIAYGHTYISDKEPYYFMDNKIAVKSGGGFIYKDGV